MPTYSYRCSKCSTVFDYIETISRRNESQVCPRCGGTAQRDEEAEYQGVRYNGECDHERESISLGCMASQIDQFRKLHPGAEFRKKGNSYVMVIHNRAEKLRRMKERGFVEFDHKHDETIHG